MILIVKPSIASGGRQGELHRILDMSLWNMIWIIKLSYDLRRLQASDGGGEAAEWNGKNAIEIQKYFNGYFWGYKKFDIILQILNEKEDLVNSRDA